MKITVKTEHGTFTCKLPYEGCEHVVAPKEAHPECADDEGVSLRGGNYQTGHDEYTASCFCATCGTNLGTMVVKVSTIFGIEEDNRVLNGRWRVY